jgi:hypothetical protein
MHLRQETQLCVKKLPLCDQQWTHSHK